MKKITRILLLSILMFSLVACGGSKKITGVGEKRSTAFLDFTIESIQVVDYYGEYEPMDGYKMVDIVIYTINQMDQSIPMFVDDYYVFYNEEIYWAEYPYDDTMAPDSNTLEVGEDMKAHYIYIIPEEAMEFELQFMEYFSDGTEGELHSIVIKLN